MDMAPPDRWHLMFFIFILHGAGTLIPWNMFITAKSYFVDFKLEGTSNFASNYLQYVGFASQIPNVVFNWLNVFVRFGGDFTKRIIYSLTVVLLIFLITIMLAMTDSSDWPGTFFWITMISVVILNAASGVYQNTVFGLAAILPGKYIGAVVLGNNVCGLFVTIVSILSKYVFSSHRTAAIYYFLTAVFVILACLDTYFALPLVKFFRFYKKENQTATEKNTTQTEARKIPYWTIYKQAFPQLINVFYIFFVTLALFPAVQSDIKASDKDFFVKPDYFALVTCFLTFNLFAMLGSLTTTWVQCPKPKYLYIPVFLRTVFLPLFLFCNYRPMNGVRVLTVIIYNEWIYWIIAVIMAYSSGYLSSLAMMYAPGYVEAENQSTAGMLAAAMLISGIFCGILFSFLFPLIVI